MSNYSKLNQDKKEVIDNIFQTIHISPNIIDKVISNYEILISKFLGKGTVEKYEWVLPSVGHIYIEPFRRKIIVKTKSGKRSYPICNYRLKNNKIMFKTFNEVFVRLVNN